MSFVSQNSNRTWIIKKYTIFPNYKKKRFLWFLSMSFVYIHLKTIFTITVMIFFRYFAIIYIRVSQLKINFSICNYFSKNTIKNKSSLDKKNRLWCLPLSKTKRGSGRKTLLQSTFPQAMNGCREWRSMAQLVEAVLDKKKTLQSSSL